MSESAQGDSPLRLRPVSTALAVLPERPLSLPRASTRPSLPRQPVASLAALRFLLLLWALLLLLPLGVAVLPLLSAGRGVTRPLVPT